MRLSRPLYCLPVRFDAERLHAEVAALPDSAWMNHPNQVVGNRVARLITVGGGENDDVDGVMQPTAHLWQSPYLRQVLASFGVVWSRSQLLRLAPGASAPEHADINYHWFSRVRVHIPISAGPEIRFNCGDESVHMPAGDAWLFDDWRLHRLENLTANPSIHLIAGTSGSAAFWQLLSQPDEQGSDTKPLRYETGREARPLTERTTLAPVMTPAEVDFLILDLRAELVARLGTSDAQSRLPRYHAILDAFCRDWRQLYALYGRHSEGRTEFTRLRDSVRQTSRSLSDALIMRTNGVAAHAVFEERVLQVVLPAATAASANDSARSHR